MIEEWFGNNLAWGTLFSKWFVSISRYLRESGSENAYRAKRDRSIRVRLWHFKAWRTVGCSFSGVWFSDPNSDCPIDTCSEGIRRYIDIRIEKKLFLGPLRWIISVKSEANHPARRTQAPRSQNAMLWIKLKLE